METGPHGTFGFIDMPDGLRLFTGELPDKQNAPNISCIPPGIYNCAWTFSPAFKRMMYLVADVPKRSGIRIHSANFMGDKAAGLRAQLNGCLALGRRLGTIDGQKALILSSAAVTALESFMGREPFILEVISCSN